MLLSESHSSQLQKQQRNTKLENKRNSTQQQYDTLVLQLHWLNIDTLFVLNILTEFNHDNQSSTTISSIRLDRLYVVL